MSLFEVKNITVAFGGVKALNDVSFGVDKGEIFTKENLKKVRPGGGVNTVYYSKILGKKAFKYFSAGTAFSRKYLKKLKIKKQLIY